MACRRPTSTRRFSCPTVMPAPTVPWPAADRPASSGRLAPGPHRQGDGDLTQVCEDLARPYAAEGEAGLRDRSSRPHSTPDPDQRRGRVTVVELRRLERRGPDWIGAELGVPARTVSRILRRHPMPQLARVDPITGEVIRASRSPRSATNATGQASWSTWTSRSSAGSPTAAAGRLMAVARADPTAEAKIGYDYVHSLVDDHTRLAYSEVLPDEKGHLRSIPPARRRVFASRHPRIQEVITDNHMSYKLSRDLRAAIARSAPGTCSSSPSAPGKTAKSNASTAPWPSNGPTARLPQQRRRAAALAPWLEYYNTGRRHCALGGHPPITRLPT